MRKRSQADTDSCNGLFDTEAGSMAWVFILSQKRALSVSPSLSLLSITPAGGVQRFHVRGHHSADSSTRAGQARHRRYAPEMSPDTRGVRPRRPAPLPPSPTP